MPNKLSHLCLLSFAPWVPPEAMERLMLGLLAVLGLGLFGAVLLLGLTLLLLLGALVRDAFVRAIQLLAAPAPVRSSTSAQEWMPHIPAPQRGTDTSGFLD